MKIKQLISAVLSALLFSAAASSFTAYKKSSIQPELCFYLTVADDGNIYGIDYDTDKQKYHLYKCSEKADEAVIITKSAEKNKRRYVYDKLILDEITGRLYVHVSEYGCTTGLLEKEEIFLCDFDNYKFKPVWKIDSSDEQIYSVECYMIKNGVLYYLDKTDNEVLICRKDEENSTIIKKIRNSETVFSEYSLLSETTVAAFSTNGGLYVEENGNWRQKYGKKDNAGSYTGFSTGHGIISFIDLNTDSRIIFDTTSKSITSEALMYEIQANNCTVTADMLDSINILPDNGFIANTELPPEIQNEKRLHSGIIVYKNNETIIYTQIKCNNKYIIHCLILSAVIFLGISIAIILIGFLLYKLFSKRKYIPIQLEIIFFAVLLFGGGTGFTAYQINRLLTQSFNESYQKVFDDLENEMNKELDALIKENFQPWNDSYITDSDFQKKISSIMSNSIIQNHETGENEFAPYYVLHIQNSDGELIMAYNYIGKKNIMTKYVYHNSYVDDEYTTVLNNNKSKNLTQYDKEGVWNVHLCPYNNNGMNAIIEIGIDQYLTDWKTKQITLKIIYFIIASCVIMLWVMIIFLGTSFSTLKKLGRQIESGKIEKPVNYGSKETLSIWEQLYVMLKNTERRRSELEENNQQYYRYISLNLVNLISADGLDDALPGKQRKFFAEYLCVVFSEKSVSQIYKIAQSHGGILYLNEPLKVMWLFCENNNAVFETADEIYNTVKEKKLTCGIGIGSGKALIYVRGTESHADIAVSSVESELAGKLAEYSLYSGKKYLLTESALKLIDKRHYSN